MKRFLSLGLILLLSMMLTTGCSNTQNAQNTSSTPPASDKPESTSVEETTLPKPGDMVNGFKVISVEPMNPLGAIGVLFEHEKSGAELLYLASDDTNRFFDITFKTPVLDRKGKPHVFEHINTGGSQKYPNPNLIFPIMDQTYNTYVDAISSQCMTTYSVASMSEEQLMTLMDYYLSGVFHPLFYTEPQMVQREAWRYELASADDPITVAGTVYSEMQGMRTLQYCSLYNHLFTLFQDSPVAHESGGFPDEIRTLTYDELIAFHKDYYHPSNSLITLYGDLDYRAFLEYIDENYLSDYERKEILVERGRIEPYTETRYATYEMPAEQNANTENESYCYYSFALDNATLFETLTGDLLVTVFNTESSPFLSAMHEKLPGADVAVDIYLDSPVPQIQFGVSGINESDCDLFVSIVDQAIADLAANGIEKEQFDAAILRKKLELMLTSEDYNWAAKASKTISTGWTCFGTTDYYNVCEQVLNDTTTESLNNFIQKWLVDNTYRAVSLTKPVAGLAEQNSAALEDELAKKKAAMSEEEVNALVAQYNEFIEWNNKVPPDELLQQLVSVTADRLPEEVPQLEIEDKTKDGIRYLTAETSIAGVEQTKVMLDASTFPINQIQDAKTYLLLVGKLNTETSTKEDIDTLIKRYLPKLSMSIATRNGIDGVSDNYSVSISWTSLTENYDKSVEVLRELLYKTEFDDMETVCTVLSRIRTSLCEDVEKEPLNTQIQRCQAALHNTAAFEEYSFGLAYYNYLTDIITLCEKDPDAFTARMEAARELVLNKNNAIVLFAGDRSAIDTFEVTLPTIFDDMADAKREPVDYSSLRLHFSKEILLTDMPVHMNLIMAKNDEKITGKQNVISALVNDLYIVPQLRNIAGAYDANSSFAGSTFALYTYYDLNCAESFETFQALPEYMRTAAITQEMVNRYIVGCYSDFTPQQGVQGDAIFKMENLLAGITDDVLLSWMRDAKSTTVEDVRAYADMVEAFLKDGVYSTSGTLTSFGEDAKLFDSTVRYAQDQSAD